MKELTHNTIYNIFYGWNEVSDTEPQFSATLKGVICDVAMEYLYDEKMLITKIETNDDCIRLKSNNISFTDDLYPHKEKAEKIFRAMNINV